MEVCLIHWHYTNLFIIIIIIIAETRPVLSSSQQALGE